MINQTYENFRRLFDNRNKKTLEVNKKRFLFITMK